MWRKLSEKLSVLGGIRVKLEVRSGLHRGVERRLDQGTHSFGHSPDCDFVFEDRALQPLAFELKVGSRSVELTAEQPMGVHNGNETLLVQSGFHTAMPVPGEIHIDDICMAILPDDRGSSLNAWTTRNPLLTGAAAIAAIIAGVYLTAQAGNRSEPGGRIAQEERIQTFLTEKGYADRLEVVRDGEAWKIRGEVEKRAEAEDIATAMREMHIGAVLDVTDRQSVLRSIQTILSAYPGRLAANWQDDRTITVSGYVANDDVKSSLENALLNDVRGAETLDLEVKTHRDILQSMLQELERKDLNSRVRLDLADNIMVASGQLNESDIERWRDTKIWYDRQFEGILPIRTDFSDPGPLGPDIDIRAIWSGEEPYVIAGNGGKYSPGAILPGGWQIIDILSDRVVLDRNGAMVELRM